MSASARQITAPRDTAKLEFRRDVFFILSSVGEAVLQKRPEGGEAVFPGYFFAFRIASAVVGDGQFIDALLLVLADLGSQFRFDGKTVGPDADGFLFVINGDHDGQHFFYIHFISLVFQCFVKNARIRFILGITGTVHLIFWN